MLDKSAVESRMAEHGIAKEDFVVQLVLKKATISALIISGNNRTIAAKLMGISLRTLRSWIKLYDLYKFHPPSRQVKGSPREQK